MVLYVALTLAHTPLPHAGALEPLSSDRNTQPVMGTSVVCRQAHRVTAPASTHSHHLQEKHLQLPHSNYTIRHCPYLPEKHLQLPHSNYTITHSHYLQEKHLLLPHSNCTTRHCRHENC
jgi:hypothetical protein